MYQYWQEVNLPTAVTGPEIKKHWIKERKKNTVGTEFGELNSEKVTRFIEIKQNHDGLQLAST